MSKAENHPRLEQKEAFEYIIGAFILIILMDGLVLAIGDNIIFWGLFFIGIILGLLHSKRKFQHWQSFVAWKIIEDSKHVPFMRRILSVVIVVGISMSYPILRMYVGKEIMFGSIAILFGFYTGSLLCLFWLHRHLKDDV
jgi:hypothetical protein